jgi:hypothetical protein
MKHLKKLRVAALATAALTAFLGAGGASATTLEVGGATQNKSVALTLSLEAGTSLLLRDTAGFSLQTCGGSHTAGETASPYTSSTVTAPSTTLTFIACSDTTTVHKPGTLHISHISGTTNGTVVSSGAEWTWYSTSFGAYLNCKTGAGTHLGRLTGVKEGHARLDVNAVLSCSGISAKIETTYAVTSPTGLGVEA